MRSEAAYPRDQRSADGFLDERADQLLSGGSQLLQREGGGPQGAIVEVGRVVEAEGGVARIELGGALEEADDLTIPGIGGHAVPGFRREGRRAGCDDGRPPG